MQRCFLCGLPAQRLATFQAAHGPVFNRCETEQVPHTTLSHRFLLTEEEENKSTWSMSPCSKVTSSSPPL
ncbi:hypothetical protein PBY51_006047 [Eleginops maclovinus]|uniref:Uncharacterized protein n=1 Tax=Eleginops maclovinus TaxID=56733 RepID=A0AAN7WR21_ELEMC|nr:hypothetical protein PBY51_006047 [Eleginops maclovinus]